MSYDQICEPGIVKDGHLCMKQALGVISLLPLAEPTAPHKLLQRLMLENLTPAILVDLDSGDDKHSIPSSFWQSGKAGAAFQTMTISAPIVVGSSTVLRSGWIVFQTALVKRAIVPLLERPELPRHVVEAHADPRRRHLVNLGIQTARETAFDEAVKRWRASGDDAQEVERPIFAAKIETAAECVARIAKLQAASKSLGSVPGYPPDWSVPAMDGRGKVIEGTAIRVANNDEPRPTPPQAPVLDGRKRHRVLYMQYVERWFKETGGAPGDSEKERKAQFESWLRPIDEEACRSCMKLNRATQFRAAIKRLRDGVG